MKTTRYLGCALSLLAGAVGSVSAQQKTNLDDVFKPIVIMPSPSTILNAPAMSQVEPKYRTFSGSGIALLGPLGDSVADFLTWADKLNKTARSQQGVLLSNGGILRLDGRDLMISSPSGFLKRNGILYGIANGKGTAGPALRVKF